MGLRDKYESKWKEEFRVCKKAAEQGNVQAQFDLGMMYNRGRSSRNICFIIC